PPVAAPSSSPTRAEGNLRGPAFRRRLRACTGAPTRGRRHRPRTRRAVVRPARRTQLRVNFGMGAPDRSQPRTDVAGAETPSNARSGTTPSLDADSARRDPGPA